MSIRPRWGWVPLLPERLIPVGGRRPPALPHGDGSRERIPCDEPSRSTTWGARDPAPRPLRVARSLPPNLRSNTMATKRLTIQQRKEVFHTLVTTQDLGLM